MNQSKREMNKYGLSIKSLSHEDNFPYNSGYMAYTQSEDNLRSKIDIASKNPKGMGFRSQVILPKDETNFKENHTEFFKFIDNLLQRTGKIGEYDQKI